MVAESKTINEDVKIVNDILTWESGTWEDGIWKGGVWKNGFWESGTWERGVWKDGVWKRGTWKNGFWESGIWERGVWIDGIWENGIWIDGIWESGFWENGIWENGIWIDGVWENGTWERGVWKNGVWKRGTWKNGFWESGIWEGSENRLSYMLSLSGLHYNSQTKTIIGYRTTNKNGTGRWNSNFVQIEGEYFEENLPPSGQGTCIKGIHIASAARAWTLLGVDKDCQFWRVEIKKEDILDCDGEKARIRGGIFTKIEKPF